MMRIAASLFLMFLSSFASADMTFTQREEGDQREPLVHRVQIKGDKARIEYEGKEGYSIVDLKAGKLLMVDPSEKIVTFQTLASIQQAAKMISEAMNKYVSTLVEKTDEITEINGFRCRRYNVKTADIQTVYWFDETVDISEFVPFRNLLHWGKEIGNEKLNAIKGMAIRIEYSIPQDKKQTMHGITEILNISYKPVNGSVFRVPADYTYKERKVPSFEQRQ